MTAPELLAAVEARGGIIAVALDTTGAAMLKVTPRGIVPDLLPDLARFKPALLELLQQPDARELLAAVKAATRSHWLCASPDLLSQWKRFNAHFDANLTSSDIGAIARLITDNEHLDNDTLLTQIGAILR